MSMSVRLGIFNDVHGAVSVGHASYLAEQMDKASKLGHLTAMSRMLAAVIAVFSCTVISLFVQVVTVFRVVLIRWRVVTPL